MCYWSPEHIYVYPVFFFFQILPYFYYLFIICYFLFIIYYLCILKLEYNG